ncbi:MULTISPECIES: ROK family protein [Paenibacillus]|uniref:ROK family protein n=1 Tax=Paenibacillus TaxID=44249 RepID=UPI0001AFD650|nr:ROK family protein [Paenibacillus sp. IHBB 10380]EES71690.1 ROK family protein [Paenibacillus sp. oral taxon 786 str. D14]OXL87554.1 sugar kinase [Paenibacillus sp. SSG-1]
MRMDQLATKQSVKKTVYQHIAHQGVVSKADLLPSYSLTSSTMNRLLDELLGDGLIVESGFGPSNGGRKPILYKINEAYGYVFGLEISRFYSTLGLFDMGMNAKSSVRWRMDQDMTPDHFVAYVAGQIRNLLADHGLTESQVIGIGIGAVGPLNRDEGLILNPLYFPASGWNNVRICERIEAATGIQAKLDNGANTALIGEHWALRHEGIEHMVYVHAGMSMRSAMMSHGRIIYGSVDMEGSIGQMIIQSDGPRLHEEGNYGALEAYVSIQALEKQARSDAKMGRGDLTTAYHMSAEQISYDILLRELARDNAYVSELFLRAACYFGIGLSNVINLFHPQTIILGGTLVNSHNRFFQTATEVAKSNAYYYPEYVPVFSKGVLKEDAVATGAALMVWKAMPV